VTKISLSDARALLGITQAQLASRADVKVTAISDIETGRTENPGYLTVMRLVQALQSAGMKGLRPEHLFPVEAVEERAS
jgi:transcriptional regulator with XRE-family HTH domain